MADLLVPLYGLPDVFVPGGFTVRRPMASESGILHRWISEEFSEGWASEILPGVSRTPATLFIAAETESGSPAGFCAWDCTALGFLGPVGVAQAHRKKGLGKGLVLSVLHSMAEQGYGYAVVGDAGPSDFFRRVCGAEEIAGSSPGIYSRRIEWK